MKLKSKTNIEFNRAVLRHWYTSKQIHWRLKNIAIKTNHFLKLVSYEVKYTDARKQRSIKLCSHGQWIDNRFNNMTEIKLSTK